jgi:hypothetical protein
VLESSFAVLSCTHNPRLTDCIVGRGTRYVEIFLCKCFPRRSATRWNG